MEIKSFARNWSILFILSISITMHIYFSLALFLNGYMNGYSPHLSRLNIQLAVVQLHTGLYLCWRQSNVDHCHKETICRQLALGSKILPAIYHSIGIVNLSWVKKSIVCYVIQHRHPRHTFWDIFIHLASLLIVY